MNIEQWYVLTLDTGQKVLKRTSYHKDAILSKPAKHYMFERAEGIYFQWLKAIETKNRMRSSIRWWEWRQGELLFSTKPLTDTYVSLLVHFLSIVKANDILLQLLDMSLNAQEKLELQRQSNIYKAFKEK